LPSSVRGGARDAGHRPGPWAIRGADRPAGAKAGPQAGRPGVQDAVTARREGALNRLSSDVFSADFVRAYIEHKRMTEVLELKTRPHPHEFEMYFDG
jgi:glutamine synthetase